MIMIIAKPIDPTTAPIITSLLFVFSSNLERPVPSDFKPSFCAVIDWALSGNSDVTIIDMTKCNTLQTISISV